MSSQALTSEEKERFSRHLNLPGFDETTQLRLKNGSVLVVGVGGLGSPVAMYLAAAGVGILGIAEFDRVERHNLQRQILFNNAEVGQKKADVAKTRLEALYPDIEVKLHREGVRQENALEILSGYDVIVDGTDNFGTRYLLNDASFFCGKPLVSGSVFQMEGQIMVLNPSKEAPCYRCLFPEPPKPGSVPNCNEAGVVGALCGVVGSIQAMEAIKLLTGLGKSWDGKLLKMDLLENRFVSIQVQKDTHCPLCGKASSIKDLNSVRYSIPCDLSPMKTTENKSISELGMEIDVVSAKQLITEANALPLDIRELEEAQICQVDGSQFIPMGEIANRLVSLPRDRVMVVYCHYGFRSLRVVQYLRSAGFSNCTSMKGGIDRWAEVCEPGMNRY